MSAAPRFALLFSLPALAAVGSGTYELRLR